MRSLVLLAVLALAALAFLLKPDGPGEGAQRVERQMPAESAPADLVSEEPSAHLREEMPEVELSEEGPLSPFAVEDPLGIEVLVVLDGAPVAGAEVYGVAPGDLEADAVWARHGELELSARAAGLPLYRTDKEGLTRVPRTWQPVHFVAWTRSHKGYGYTYAQPNERVTIELVERRDLLVRVTTASGAPAPGVRVIAGRRMKRAPVPSMEATTDGQGLATFIDASCCLIQDTIQGQRAVAIGLPIEVREQVDIDPGDLPKEPIELRLPPHGSLEVQLIDRHGEPYDRGGTAMIGRKHGDRTELEGSRPIESDVLVFDHLPAGGGPFVLSLGGGQFMKPMSFDLDGPAAEGERAVASVAWIEEYGRVTGIARFEDGRVAKNVTLNGTLNNHGVAGGASCETDDEGRFEMQLYQDFVGGKRSVYLRGDLDGVPHDGSLDLSFPAPPGATEVEDLILSPFPCVAAGRVVDAQGNGVFEMRLHLEVWDGVDWVSQYGRRPMTNREGEFELWERLEADQIRLSIYEDGERVDEVETVFGDRDVQLRKP